MLKESRVHANILSKGKLSTHQPSHLILVLQACKVCTLKTWEETCKDENYRCKRWADNGDCNNRKYADYMKLRCKKSCKICYTATEKPITEKPPAKKRWKKPDCVNIGDG